MIEVEGLELRPATAADRDFLLALHASTRDDLAPLPAEQRAALVELQLRAQDADYRRRHPDASDDVVVVDGERVGRLRVARRPGELLLIDVALVPGARGRGLGTRLVRGLLAEAGARRDLVRAHVLEGNPALRLYRRLGFETVAAEPPYLRLEWRPPAGDQAKTAS